MTATTAAPAADEATTRLIQAARARYDAGTVGGLWPEPDGADELAVLPPSART